MKQFTVFIVHTSIIPEIIIIILLFATLGSVTTVGLF